MSTPEQQTVFEQRIETIVSMMEQGMFAGHETEVLEQLATLKIQLGALAIMPDVLSDEDPAVEVEEVAPYDSYKTDVVTWRPPVPELKETTSMYSGASRRPSVKKMTTKDETPSSPAELYRLGNEHRGGNTIDRTLTESDEILNDQEIDVQSTRPADWRHDAVCREVDPELFFPISEVGFAEQKRLAVSVCRRCVVIDDCFNWAMEKGEAYGIWGGTTEQERRAMRYEQITDKAV